MPYFIIILFFILFLYTMLHCSIIFYGASSYFLYVFVFLKDNKHFDYFIISSLLLIHNVVQKCNKLTRAIISCLNSIWMSLYFFSSHWFSIQIKASWRYYQEGERIILERIVSSLLSFILVQLLLNLFLLVLLSFCFESKNHCIILSQYFLCYFYISFHNFFTIGCEDLVLDCHLIKNIMLFFCSLIFPYPIL